MYFISQLWEENLATQTHFVGDFFKVQRAVTMPGNDALGRTIMSVHDFKETQSVTEFEGRRFYCEALGASGWDLTPNAMKRAANCAIAWGVSSFCLHYFNFPQPGTMYAPDFGTWNPWWPYMRHLADFVRRASYINSQGRTAPDVLLLTPADSVQALLVKRWAGPAVIQKLDGFQNGADCADRPDI